MPSQNNLLLIAAPAQRCGTTLLQRLLSSIPGVLIYGETLANDLNILLGVWQSKMMMLGIGQEWRDVQLKQVLSGDVNQWIPDLLPRLDHYRTAQRSLFEHYLEDIQHRTEEYGNHRWGVKFPGWPVPQLKFFLDQFPNVKLLYIVRGLEACVQSAPKIGLCVDEHSTQQFRHYYQGNLQMAQQHLTAERTLWLSYEDLVAEPLTTLDQIEAFVELKGVNREVMNHKIDNYHSQ